MMRDLSHGKMGRMERQKEREREMSHGVRPPPMVSEMPLSTYNIAHSFGTAFNLIGAKDYLLTPTAIEFDGNWIPIT